jgi:hypothetical protein
MIKQTPILPRITFSLGVLAMASTVYTMVSIQIFKQEVFFDHVVSMPFEFGILVGTLLILLFDILSLVWVSYKIFKTKKSERLDKIALIPCVVCIFALMGTKVMADEIAREYRLGWHSMSVSFCNSSTSS